MMHTDFEPSLKACCTTEHNMHVSALQKAIKEQDAWHLCTTLTEINALFATCMPTQIPALNLQAVQDQILQESYDRLIKPKVHLLKRYLPFSNSVYGELLPPFVDLIIKFTQLMAGSLFLDLGCGVGNVIVQVSLRTSCVSVGIELVPAVAALAREMMEQTLLRCHMWGVKCSHIEVQEGDMLASSKVAELIQHADAICVNNLAFDPDRL
jgi:SAM-dependent methyltransferase